MAASKSSAGSLRKHIGADGRTSFTATVRASGFKSASKTFTSRKEALAWSRETLEFLREQREGVSRARHDVTQINLADLILEYLKSSEAQALRSYDGTHQMLSWFIQHYGTARVLDLNVLIWREAREKLQQGRQALTVNRYFICMRACWNWARAAGLVPTERMWPDRIMLPQPQGRTRFLNDAELAALLKAAHEHSQLMLTAVTVSVATGMRRGELLRLNWSDIDLTRQVADIHITKTDKPRAVHLTQSACDALKALQQAGKVRSIGGAVFTLPNGTRLKESTLEARWRKVRDAARLKDFRWHDLRHCAASYLAQSGATLLQIAEVLGHRSFTSTQRYSHLVQGAALPAHAALDAKLTGKKP